MDALTAQRHLSRDPDDAVTPVDVPFEPHFVEPPSVGGRMIPREQPQPEPCHVRFRGDGVGIHLVAYCDSHSEPWSVVLSPGHDLQDLARLVREHAGEARVADAERDTP